MDERSKDFLLENIQLVLPVIPTLDVVMFPHMVVPLLVVDEQVTRGIEHALNTDKKVLLLATKPCKQEQNNPIGIEDLYQIGTVAMTNISFLSV